MILWIAIALTSMAVSAGLLYRSWLQQQELNRTKALFEVSLNINSTLMKDELLKIIMVTAAEVLKAEGSSVILLDQRKGELYFEVATGEKGNEVKEIRLKLGEGIAGWVAQTGESVKIDDASKDPRWSNKVAAKVEYPTRNLLCVPVVNRGEIIGVLQVINKKNGRPFTDRDLELLQSIAAPTAIALENASLYEALQQSIQTLKETTAVKERMESELSIAKEIQMSFLPVGMAANPQYELASLIRPAREVGGDFYNYYALDEQHLFFVLGDVSDKGLPAALFMTVTLTLLKANMQPGSSPGMVLGKVNQELYSDESTMFATVFCGILNIYTGELIYSNGGHCVPYIRYVDGSVSPLPVAKGIPLAVLPESVYIDEQIRLHRGDSLLLYTDGISEAEKINHEMFGTANLQQCLREKGGGSAEDSLSELLNTVDEFTGRIAQSDDIAVLLIKLKEEQGT
jgi:sigma-B regulation protein RsbU (phosphoserine phosphatase)